MIKHVQISGSDYSMMQQIFTSRPHYSASIHTTSSLSDPVITCNVTYESYDWIVNVLKHMSYSASFFNDLPSTDAYYSASL